LGLWGEKSPATSQEEEKQTTSGDETLSDAASPGRPTSPVSGEDDDEERAQSMDEDDDRQSVDEDDERQPVPPRFVDEDDERAPDPEDRVKVHRFQGESHHSHSSQGESSSDTDSRASDAVINDMAKKAAHQIVALEEEAEDAAYDSVSDGGSSGGRTNSRHKSKRPRRGGGRKWRNRRGKGKGNAKKKHMPRVHADWKVTGSDTKTLTIDIGSKEEKFGGIPKRNLKKAAKFLHPDSIAHLQTAPSMCRCARGCASEFTRRDIWTQRHQYLKHATEERASLAIVEELRQMRSGTTIHYYLRHALQHSDFEVCSRFYQKATGFSEGKMLECRGRAQHSGTPDFKSGNIGKTYSTAKQARRICKAFWLDFYDTRCQKPNDKMWLAPSQLTTSKYTSFRSALFSLL
jgi:hypothetical protein